MENYPKTMKVLAAYSKTDYRFEAAYPTPERGDDNVIIKIEACGICTDDLKCRGDEVQPSWVKPPFIPGHKFLGRLVETGKHGDLKEALVP
jgi:L-iditol 2-dehydrogenase